MGERKQMSACSQFVLYASDCREIADNCVYPNRAVITGHDALRAAVTFDHVAAEYKNGHRCSKNFIQADCLPLDVDNTDTDIAENWHTPADVARAFPGVAFAVCYSRNHMKVKRGKTARPKFHVYYPIASVTDERQYRELKQTAYHFYPKFDDDALDSARFFFGVENPQVEFFEGDLMIDDFLKSHASPEAIPEGQRNATLSQAAAKLLTRYGDSDEARERFDREAKKCSPPLEDSELDMIWKSAQKFFHATIENSPDYLAPEVYNADLLLKPSDYTDVGEALILAREYGNGLRHSPATNFLVYSGQVWEENAARARGCLHDLTQRQLDELTPVLLATIEAVKTARVTSGHSCVQEAEQRAKAAQAYQKFILKCRDSRTITGVMKEAQTPFEIDVAELDKNPYLLNTPSGEVDLRTGDLSSHNPGNYHTKITAVASSNEGMDVWRDFLKVVTCGDAELEQYLQLIAGQMAVGRVFFENLIIAYGSGRNGKSTLFNIISRVFGDYAGQISAESLTTGRKNGKNWELAELRGKRLIVAPELEEGTRLDASFIKKICSTDKILGEQKYKSPFSFEPSHTTVLYTNHLPKVGSSDAGTWRRLVVVPFNAVIEGRNDKKNYADFVLQHAGGAVLSWIVEGATRLIKAGYKIEPPQCVKQAIERYRKDNDWLNNYLLERCKIDKSFRQKSGELYADYRAYCLATGEYPRSSANFKKAIEDAGIETHDTNKGTFILGLHITEMPEPLYGNL